MAEYFKKIYADPAASATLDDPEYQRLQMDFRKEERELQDAMDVFDTKLFKKYERVFDAYFQAEYQLLADVYLMGARDRERMLE